MAEAGIVPGDATTQVILRNQSDEADAVTHPNASPTLDVLFRRILARQPDALALVDPPNKQRITGQPPKRPGSRKTIWCTGAASTLERNRVIAAATCAANGGSVM